MKTPRPASEAPFPYGWAGYVAYFVTAPSGLQQIANREDMRAAIAAALLGQVEIYAAWPGEYRTDLFYIDEPELLAQAVGMLQPTA